MADNVKQRIVGAVALLSMAAIFLPVILDGDNVAALIDPVTIPIEPTLPEIPFPVNQVQENIDRTAEAVDLAHSLQEADSGVSSNTTSSDSASETGEPSASEVQPDVVPAQESQLAAAWVVQLGSFIKIENAQALLDTLHQQKYRAYISTTKRDGTEYSRVMVGPELRREDAQALKKALARDTSVKLNGQVLRYLPK